MSQVVRVLLVFACVIDPFLFPLCTDRYQYMRDFDRAMHQLDDQFAFMIQGPGLVSRKHDNDKVIVFERGGLLWIFNFHPNKVHFIQL